MHKILDNRFRYGFIVVMLFAATLLFAVSVYVYFWNQKVETWLDVPATIDSTHVITDPYPSEGSGKIYGGRLDYSFIISGNTYYGKCHGSYDADFDNNIPLLKKYHPGNNIVIKANPSDPHQNNFHSESALYYPAPFYHIGVISMFLYGVAYWFWRKREV